MYPVLFQWGPITLYTYGAMMVVAFLTATGLAIRAAKRLPNKQAPITPSQIADASCIVLLGGLLGGRLFFVVLHWEEFAQRPLEMFALWHGGLVWYGGFFGGFLAAWGYARIHRLDFRRLLDFYAPFLALGHAIGRVGCFLNGCCYGKSPNVPVQLFEAAGLVLLYGALRRLQRESLGERRGGVFSIYLIGYAVLRFVIEGLRGDQVVWWAGLTLQQLISIAILIAGLFLYYDAYLRIPYQRRRSR